MTVLLYRVFILAGAFALAIPLPLAAQAIVPTKADARAKNKPKPSPLARASIATRNPTPLPSGLSENWKVTVVSARKYTWALRNLDEYGPPADAFNLILELEFEYRGSDGDVSSPQVAVVNEQGTRYGRRGTINFSSNELAFMDWLMSSNKPEPGKKFLKTGTRLGKGTPVTFYFSNISKASNVISLSFADIPMFPITLSWLKEENE